MVRTQNKGAAGVWTEASLRVSPEAVEAAAELLQDLTGNGVTVEPPIEALGPDEGYVLDESAPVRIVAYFRGPVAASRRAALRRRLTLGTLKDAVRGRLAWREIREQDWAEAWKQHYDVERVGRIAVRPAWREYAAAPGETVISLDPGMAFGTGQHPTTRMCLAAMQALLRGGERVLDLGSGSGILAIAAIALGAAEAVAVDTEEQAVKATAENAALNGMQAWIDVRLGSMEAAAPDGPYDLILANINAAAVSTLAAAMAAALKSGAWLLAGGVIAEREAGVAEALRAAGLRIDRVMADGDWRTFVARKA